MSSVSDDQERPDAARADEPRRVLVAGAGRSGTTWVSEVLGRAPNTSYVHEPDNFDWVPFAGRARAGMGLLPAVERGASAPEQYTRLWDAAFGVGRRSIRDRIAYRLYAGIPDRQKYAVIAPGGRARSLRQFVATRLAKPAAGEIGSIHRVVKSVTIPLALEWLAARFTPEVVLVRRHPLDVLASRIGFGTMFLDNVLHYVDQEAVEQRLERWGSPRRPSRDDRFGNFVWMAAFTISAYDDVAQSHPEFHVVDHETLRADPVPELRRLVTAVGLEWSEQCEAHLRASNAPGIGFETRRVAGASTEDGRRRLSAEQLRIAKEILAGFPVAERYADLGGTASERPPDRAERPGPIAADDVSR